MAQGKDPVSSTGRTQEIESDIDRTRAAMDRTFDAIAGKLTPQQLMVEALSVFKAGGSTMAQKLVETAREHPVRLACGLERALFVDRDEAVQLRLHVRGLLETGASQLDRRNFFAPDRLRRGDETELRELAHVRFARFVLFARGAFKSAMKRDGSSLKSTRSRAAGRQALSEPARRITVSAAAT